MALNSNDDNRMQSIDSIETHAHEMSKDKVSKKKSNKM